MRDTQIIYCSKTGFSKRYAQWLAETLGCRAIPYRERGTADLEGCGTVILTGSLWAGKMLGLDWLKKQLPRLAGKRVAALAVGASPEENPNLPGTMEALFGSIPGIRGFYAQGGLDYQHMGAVDRAMMAMMRSALKRQKGQEEALRVISASFDATDRRFLEPLLAWVREEA